MKKSISLILAVIMLFSIVNVSVFAEGIDTPYPSSVNNFDGVNVWWNDVDGAVKYVVYRREAGSKLWIIVGETEDTYVIDSTVTDGKYYAYSIRAYDENGLYSAYKSDYTCYIRFIAAPKLTGLVNDTKGLKLTWATVEGAVYRIYRRGAGQNWVYLGTTNDTTYIDSKATSGNYWRYTIKAVINGYQSGYDWGGLCTVRLANPYSIKATQVNDCVNVTWGKINGATSYRIYRRGAGQSYWTYLGASTGNNFKDSNISGGQYYRYTVRATRGNVFSSYSTSGALIKTTITKAMICDCYKKVLNSYPEKSALAKVSYDTMYTLYDIDKNGVPELIVNQKSYHYYVYTCVNGTAKLCGEFSSNYSKPLYSYKGNGLVVHDGGMGRYHVEYLWLFTLNNNILSDAKTLITTESNYTYDDLYNVRNRYAHIEDYCKVRDYSLLNKTFN